MPSRSGQNWAQREDELHAFIQLLNKEKTTSYLEIGSRYGDTFFHIMKNLPVGSIGVAVDMVDGYWGRSDSRPYLEEAVAELNSMGYQTSCVFGDSSTPSTIRQVLGKKTQYDCILVDGDHRFEGLTLDWINYAPLARMVAFHDIDGWDQFERRSGAPVEVPQVWSILKRHRKYKEIVGAERGMGIGVLWM